MRAVCQLCAHEYAEVSIEGRPAEKGMAAIAPLRYPLKGDQFGSPDPFHGYPAPFDPSLTWTDFRCPMGRIHRPMVCDDLVLTHKGMVRLPKDGSPAFLDPTAKAEVDRECISDRTVMVSDEEAEKRAREILQGGPKVIVSDEVPDGTVLFLSKKGIAVMEPGKKPEIISEEIPKTGMIENVAPDPLTCPECGKVCKNVGGLNGHMRSHKKK